jgi:hypothetical protein
MAFGQFCLDDATLVDCKDFVGVVISCKIPSSEGFELC